jgi:hypothetical protein
MTLHEVWRRIRRRKRIAELPSARRVLQPTHSRGRERILHHHLCRRQAATRASSSRGIARLPSGVAHERMAARAGHPDRPDGRVTDGHAVQRNLEEAQHTHRSLGLDVEIAPADDAICTPTTDAIGRVNEEHLWTVSIMPVCSLRGAYLRAG